MRNRYRILYSILLTGFLLGVRNGYIALWKSDDPEPIKIFPYKVQLLPPKDAERLEQGIRFENSADLSRILEDFMS